MRTLMRAGSGHGWHERSLGSEGGRQRAGSRGERRAEGIARGGEDEALVPLDGLAQDGVVASQRDCHFRGAVLPESSAALDVGEEEGDRPAGQVRHRIPPIPDP